MNYKESASKLNEFNDFIKKIHTELIINSLANFYYKLYSETLYKVRGQSPIKSIIQPAGFEFKNHNDSFILPKGESVIHDSQRIEMPLTPTRILRINKQMQIELDKIKPTDNSIYESRWTGNFFKPNK